MRGLDGREDWKEGLEKVTAKFSRDKVGKNRRPGSCSQSAGQSSRNAFHHEHRIHDDLRRVASTVPKDARIIPYMLRLTRLSYSIRSSGILSSSLYQCRTANSRPLSNSMEDGTNTCQALTRLRRQENTESSYSRMEALLAEQPSVRTNAL